MKMDIQENQPTDDLANFIEPLTDFAIENLQCLQSRQKELYHLVQNDTNYCTAIWDSVYCWPYTRAGETAFVSCAEVMKDTPGIDSHQLKQITGYAFRNCSGLGTWIYGNWTDYSKCLESLEDAPIPTKLADAGIVDAVRWILFLGSILSFLCLAISLFIYYYFRCLRCDRVTLHNHLMFSLALRFILLIFITEPFIFQRSNNYRNVDWICKGVMCLLMYATVASVNWMFVQGHFLHGRLTTNIFDSGTPFKIYYSIGWGLPLVLIICWAVVMETFHPVHCWKQYSELHYLWILLGPMIFALSANLIFLVNIMRILLTKIQRANISTDAAQFRRAVKATAILVPLLGINNLAFVYNPGGDYEAFYMITNTILHSSQGIFVSFLYCFISSDVRDAIRREYRRFAVRRSANSIRHHRSQTWKSGHGLPKPNSSSSLRIIRSKTSKTSFRPHVKTRQDDNQCPIDKEKNSADMVTFIQNENGENSTECMAYFSKSSLPQNTSRNQPCSELSSIITQSIDPLNNNAKNEIDHDLILSSSLPNSRAFNI